VTNNAAWNTAEEQAQACVAYRNGAFSARASVSEFPVTICYRAWFGLQPRFGMKRMRWWMLLATGSWPVVVCRGDCQATIGGPGDSAQVQMESLARTHATYECHPYTQSRVLTDGMPSVAACLAESHDTVFFTHNASGAVLAVAGRRVGPDSGSRAATLAHLSRVTESELTRKFGKPTNCVVDEWAGPLVTRYLLWRRHGYVVQYRTTHGSEARYSEFPMFVDVEIVRDERGDWRCLDWIEIADWYE
jgi:hypothetical protein